ncbi:hypothetical protein ACP4OV_025800 [Aristida adscensionis]
MDSGSSKAEEVAAYQSSEAKQARLQSMLSALLDDPILADVPRKPSLADVDTLMNLELGSAMRVTVVKLDNTSFDVAVSNSATVKDLKLAIRKKINEIEQKQMGHRHISWSCNRTECGDSTIVMFIKLNDMAFSYNNSTNYLILCCLCELPFNTSLLRKHVWDNYCLTNHNEKLLDDNSALSSHDIRNNSKSLFLPTHHDQSASKAL